MFSRQRNGKSIVRIFDLGTFEISVNDIVSSMGLDVNEFVGMDNWGMKTICAAPRIN